MKTSELIKYLQESLEDFGDLDVRVGTDNFNHYPLETMFPHLDKGYIALDGWDD